MRDFRVLRMNILTIFAPESSTIDDMKKTLTVLLCAVLSALTSFAQSPIPAHFDECVELIATVWRLSGADEYNRCRVSQYAHEVDSVQYRPVYEHFRSGFPSCQELCLARRQDVGGDFLPGAVAPIRVRCHGHRVPY